MMEKKRAEEKENQFLFFYEWAKLEPQENGFCNVE